MARLNLKAIEERIKPLAGQDDYDRGFIFDLLLAYGRSKGNITRLRNGSLNIAEDPEHEVAQKNIVYFRETTDDLLEEVERLRVSPHGGEICHPVCHRHRLHGDDRVRPKD